MGLGLGGRGGVNEIIYSSISRKNGIFFDVGLSVDPPNPPKFTPPLEVGPFAIPGEHSNSAITTVADYS